MSLVINTQVPSAREIKNLGWLLRNWREVESVALFPFEDKVSDGFLIAYLRDERVYVTSFASFDVAREWLDRPVFRGLPLNDCGVWKEITYSHKRSDVDRIMTGIARADAKDEAQQ